MEAKQLLKETRFEIEQIKKLATDEEKQRLNFERFEYDNAGRCIYGQMTGDCSNERAREIMPKSISINRLYMTSGSITYSSLDCVMNGYIYTSLEIYLFKCSKKCHKVIIDYIKGNRKTLILDKL